jgi:hypothetical protein
MGINNLHRKLFSSTLWDSSEVWKVKRLCKLLTDKHKNIVIKEFSKLFNNGNQQIIVSKTCSDMNYLPKLTKSIKLLILTANDSPGRDKWKEKVGEANVCICDGTRNSYLWISDLPKIPTPIQSHNFILKELLCEATVYYGGV